ncbi:hypothetical protein [Burkholderia gladioli]|uniref:hypothetical protein n=1 Tax=Burkholderia gladioli TaxID=28095 RepID=UPI001640F9D4|nr:hypothetical protein [Burkholderia gladioli]
MLTDYQAIRSPVYFGRGAVHISAPFRADGSVAAKDWPDRSPGAPLQLPPGRPLGNARRLDVTPQLTALNTSAWDPRERMLTSGITLAVELYGHGGANLAMALGSPEAQAVGGRRTDVISVSQAAIEAGSMLFTSHLVDTSFPVTVTPSWAEWQEGTHWRATEHGPLMLIGASGPSRASIEITYTVAGGAEEIHGAYRVREMSLTYAGINRYDSAAVRLECYRATLASVEAMPMISDAAGVISLSINLLPVRLGQDNVLWYRRIAGPQIAGAYAK